MRCLILAVLAIVPLASCATAHFDDVVRIAASKHPRECTAPYTVKQLNRWGYRVDACEGPLYYRCSYKRNTMGRTQCCDPVPDEESATSFIGAPGASSTCVAFVD